MTNQQLLDFIKQQKQQGVSNEEIKKSLLSNGWQSTDVEEAFGIPSISQQVSAQPKKRRWKKIILIIIAVIIILIAALFSLPIFLNLFAKDIAPINDSDIRLKVDTVPDGDNAYFDLIKLENVIYEPEGKSLIIFDMIAGRTWDDKLAEEIVSRNAQAFSIFSEAAHKPKFQDPISANPADVTPNAVLPKLSSWRLMARLSAVKALYLAKQGKDKEAMDEALNSTRIGQKIQESQASFIEYLVAITMKGIGLETVQKILITSKLSSNDLKQYAQGLSNYNNNEDGLINSFKAEYQIKLWYLDAIASGNPEGLNKLVGEGASGNPVLVYMFKDNYYFKPNKTKLLFADYFRANIKKANESCSAITATDIPRLFPTNPAKLYVEENAIGKILHDVFVASLTTINTKKCGEDLLVSATQALVAIKAYKSDTNTYPSSLNELVPSYLLSIPQDSFDGKSLKYSAEKKIIYSVGSDMQDSGGGTGDDWRTMSDPTFKVGF